MRLVPALRRLPVCFREGWITWDEDEEGVGADMCGGEDDLLREVVGRDLPFLKKGTLISDMVVGWRVFGRFGGRWRSCIEPLS